jgi:uncharacterized protein (DUF1697 family)
MRMVALLRGINVGGKRKVPMPELRALAEKAGYSEIETYVNSGNLIFNSRNDKADKVADRLEKLIEDHFGFFIDVVVRTAEQWEKYASSSPFPDAAKERPHLVLLGLSRRPFDRTVAAKLSERAGKSERIRILEDAIWVDFGGGVARSKLTPALFDKAAGSTVTMRNWRTVLKIHELLEQTV